MPASRQQTKNREAVGPSASRNGSSVSAREHELELRVAHLELERNVDRAESLAHRSAARRDSGALVVAGVYLVIAAAILLYVAGRKRGA